MATLPEEKMSDPELLVAPEGFIVVTTAEGKRLEPCKCGLGDVWEDATMRETCFLALVLILILYIGFLIR